ncbi:MAG: hypothetical protein DRH24_08955 [Deltaproteobacteria bacterium]|nr:MAG: hypothetical protein DRH24_08955 [Deltaproteobacteria bacterium]
MSNLGNKIAWFYRRASVMPLREFVLRLARFLRDVTTYFLIKYVGETQPNIFFKNNLKKKSFFFDFENSGVEWFLPEKYRKACILEADSSLRHQFSFFELKNHYFGTVIQWNYDYKNNIQSSLQYAPFLALRSFRNISDIKYVFEHNKHQDLPRLAQAYLITKNRQYLDELISRVDSWIDQCPFMFGVQWASPSVSAYRLISWTITFDLLSGCDAFSEPFFERWARSVYQHIYFVSKNYSLFSSAGNHLISEATGVFVASLRWQEFFSGRERDFLDRASKQAFSILLEAMGSQFFSDGVNREQAVSYHVFSCNQMFLSYWVGLKSGISFPASFGDRLRRAGEFLKTILNANDMPPNYGDEDSAWAFRLAADDSNKFINLLDILSVLFNDSSLVFRGTLSETAYWFFGARAAENNQLIDDKSLPAVRNGALEENYYPEGGYYVATFDRGTNKEAFFFLDCGPLGMDSTGSHGHADALSFCMSLGGVKVFIDSGTYVYKDTRERQRLRSTSAHNTLYFSDIKNQDEYLGPFLWGERHLASGHVVKPGSFFAEVKWYSGETHCRETMIEHNLITFTDHWCGTSLPSIAFHLNPQLQEFVRQVQSDCISIETDEFCCRVYARDQHIRLKKTLVSPVFYQLTETSKLEIRPAMVKGTQITEISWEFK